MDDIVRFRDEQHRPARSLEISIRQTVRNVFFILWASIKCAVFGIFILLKLAFTTTHVKSIRDQVAVVSGGASGIGSAICKELARRRCNVAVVDVDIDRALDTAEKLHLLDVKAFAYKCDVSIYDEILALKDKIQTDLGDVDILVNNAGILPTSTSLLQGASEYDSHVINVNLVSHFRMLRAFVPDMIARGRGHIVAISSMFALQASGRGISYSSANGGIRALMDGLYDLIRLDGLKLNVTTVFPALVNTKKEFINQFIASNGRTEILNPSAELLCYTPQEVAKATIDGLLKNKKYVPLPSYLASMLNFIALLPEEFQNFIHDSFKPKIRADVNEKTEPKLAPSSFFIK